MAEAVISLAKTTSTDVQLVFDGEAVRTGTIDARVLGTALTAYSEAFSRANALVNGREAQAAVRVDANFQTGSFDVSLVLVQGILENAQTLLDAAKTALELALLLGIIKHPESVIALLKFLKGGKPEKVSKLGDKVQVEFNGLKKEVTNISYYLYGDEVIRKAMASGTSALALPGIDSISFRHGGMEPETIVKEEAPYFKADELELTGDESLSGERDAVLTISKLSFKEGTKWSFYDEGAMLSATIEDADFFRDVHERKIRFADGDRLQVHLKWELIEKNGRFVAENIITKVHRVVPRKRQQRLDGGKDDLV
ncbi:MAG: hypothetical protein ACM3JB_06845 [Acidobacteriaceae bacterium]